MSEEIFYEVLIRLQQELQYRKYTITDLKEIEEILKSLNYKNEEIQVKKLTLRKENKDE